MALTQEQLKNQVQKRIAADSPSGIARGKPSTDRVVKAAQDELENQQMIENAKNYEANKLAEDQANLASVGLAPPVDPQPAQNGNNQQPVEFVRQGQAPGLEPKTSAPAAPKNTAMDSAIAGLNAQGIATAQGETQKAQVYDEMLKREAEFAKKQEERSLAYQQKSAELMADLEKTNQEIKNFKFDEPSIWKNKSTPQKIIFGISAFLGSITQQGANNVIKMIDDELNRDIAAQKTEYSKLGDRLNDKKNLYKMYYDKYKDEELASAAAKNSRLDMVKLHLDKIASTTNSKVILGRTQEAIGKLQLEQEKLQAEMAVKLQKTIQDGSKGVIPGYKGSNQNTAIVKDLTERVSAKKAAEFSIQKLEGLLEEGSSMPGTKNYVLAEQIRRKLSADLAKAMFGRSSDSELQEARALIPDVTQILSRKSNSKELLKNLKNTLNTEVDAYANSAGFSKDAPLNARRIK